MAAYVKSIDNKHLLEIGMEGFYGDTMPEKKQNNPGYQVGTDFISSNLIKDIDFATIHSYPDIWYVQSSSSLNVTKIFFFNNTSSILKYKNKDGFSKSN